jgi:hypothetical protein
MSIPEPLQQLSQEIYPVIYQEPPLLPLLGLLFNCTANPPALPTFPAGEAEA